MVVKDGIFFELKLWGISLRIIRDASVPRYTLGRSHGSQFSIFVLKPWLLYIYVFCMNIMYTIHTDCLYKSSGNLSIRARHSCNCTAGTFLPSTLGCESRKSVFAQSQQRSFGFCVYKGLCYCPLL